MRWEGAHVSVPSLRLTPSMSPKDPRTNEAVRHTPHDRISYIINKLCCELDSDNQTINLQEARKLAHQAKDVIDGFDDYVAKHSSPHPKILDDILKEEAERDWGRVFQDGKTKFKLVPQMCAGEYEAVVLQHLARISGVSHTPRISREG